MENAARALFSIMVDLSKVQAEETVRIESEGEDLELLFVQWLNDLLAQAHLRGMVFCEFRIQIQGDKIESEVRGEKLDFDRHEPAVEVKGATLTQLRVGQEGGRYFAQCVVDV